MKKIAWPEGWDANNSILTTASSYPDGSAAFIQIVALYTYRAPCCASFGQVGDTDMVQKTF